jgi:hypothetical protein
MKYYYPIMKDSINAEDELSKLLSEELAKSIDAEILSDLKKMAASKSWKRKNSIDKLYKKIKDVE